MEVTKFVCDYCGCEKINKKGWITINSGYITFRVPKPINDVEYTNTKGFSNLTFCCKSCFVKYIEKFM